MADIHRTCPLCQSDESKPVFTKGPLRIVRCAACSMMYANPVDAELAAGTFYDRRGQSFYLSPEKLESDYAPSRFVRELRLFRSFCRSGRVLDVGCSTGAFLYQLNTRFPDQYEVTGADVTTAALDHAEARGVPVVRGSFLEFPEVNSGFDAITFWAVMEHLVEPKKFLEKAAALLRPGGYCFILVPNMDSLAVRLLGAKYRYIMPDHVNYFSPATLQAFCQSVPRLEMTGLKSTHFNPIVILKDIKAHADRVPDAERAQLLKRTTALKESPLLWPIKIAYSATERALALFHLADNITIILRKCAPLSTDHA